MTEGSRRRQFGMTEFFSSTLWVEFYKIVLLSLVVGSVSITITKSKFFAFLRNWLDGLSDFLGELFSCPYCMGHWIAIALTVAYQPRPIDSGMLVLDLGISAFMMIALGAVVSGTIYRVLKG